MLNKVTLIGNVGKDPETRTFQNGGKVMNFSLATTENWKSKDGERQTKTEWHNVAIFNEHLRHIAESYVTKGSKIYLEGQLSTRQWEKDGETRYTTEVVLKQFNGELKLLDSKGEKPNGADKASLSLASNNTDFKETETELNDEIPF